jgi:hypothetical protein
MIILELFTNQVLLQWILQMNIAECQSFFSKVVQLLPPIVCLAVILCYSSKGIELHFPKDFNFVTLPIPVFRHIHIIIRLTIDVVKLVADC